MIPLRYLIAVERWPGSADGPQREQGQALWAQDGVRVTANRLCHVLLGADGVVLGDVFGRDGQAVRNLQSISRRWQDLLLRDHWGRYIAVWRDDRLVHVLRDPSGSLPCYYAEHEGRIWIASDLDQLRRAGVPIRVDPARVAAQFVDGEWQAEATCVSAVSELIPGAVLTIADQQPSQRQAWLPAAFSVRAAARGSSLQVVAEELRETVVSSVRTFTSGYSRAVVELSGGLDSSIVAACVSSHRSATCATLVTADRGGDERPFARHVAKRLGLPLIEVIRDPAHLDLGQAIAPHLPRPGPRGFTQESDRLLTRCADNIGADLLLSGGGGDSVFCLLRSVVPVLDRLRARHGASGVLDTMRDAADLTGRTLWWVAHQVLRSALGLDRGASPGERLMLIAPTARAVVTSNASLHPWFTGTSSLPPGRRRHIAAIAGIQGYLHGMARGSGRTLLFPLMAQPILERCLSIASWQWIDGGFDRAVARRAFAAQLPAEIAFRRGKGHLDAFGRAVFDRHRSTIRSLLLDGTLVRSGFLDRCATEAQFALDPSSTHIRHFDLLELADSEAWCQGVAAV
jgi:asparagine synthase (glutamine-hydrolysing)